MKLELPPQVWAHAGEPPNPAKFEPVVNRRDFHWKPARGLWTSTLRDGTSDWLEWCRDNQFGSYQDAYILQPAVAVVALVRDPDDLQQLVREYGLWRRQTTPAGLSEILGGRMSSELLDWEMLAHDYDAVWFPNPYPHRLSGGMFFNILDVESTLWLRWNFYCGTIRKVSLQQEAVA